MSSMDPIIVLEALKLLTTPSNDSNAGKQNETESMWTRIEDQDGSSSDDEKYMVFEFDHLLKRNLAIFDEKIETVTNFKTLRALWREKKSRSNLKDAENPRWQFADYCAQLISILSVSLQDAAQQGKQENGVGDQSRKQPSPTPDILSVNQQKTVLTAIQFIVCLGIGPCLNQGVGIPMELRSDLGKMVAVSSQLSCSTQERDIRLLCCVKSLLNCIKVPSLGALVLSRHLTDILSCLLQLVYGQSKRVPPRGSNCAEPSQSLSPEDCLTPASVVDAVMKRNKQFSLSTESNTPSPATAVCSGTINSEVGEDSNTGNEAAENTEENVEMRNDNLELVTESDTDWCSQSLQNLLDRVYQPVLVRELLILQGGPSPQMLQKVHQQRVNRSVNSRPKAPVLCRAPQWLRRGCGHILTQVLLKPHGVQHVLRGMLDVPTGNTVPGDLDWRKCEAVAKVIANCPKQVSSVERYYRQICPQVLELLHCEDRQLHRQFARVGCHVIHTMTSQNPDLAETYLLKPLLEPLMRCVHSGEAEATKSEVIISEVIMSQCLEDLHKLLVSTLEPSAKLFTCVNSLLQPLFKLYCFLKQGVSHLRNAVQEILIAVLRSQDKVVGVSSLELCLFEEVKAGVEGRLMLPGLVFAAGPSGGVVLVDTEEKHSEEVRDQEEEYDRVKIECLVELLKDLQKDGLAGEFFIKLLKDLTSIIKEESGVQRSELTENPHCLEGKNSDWLKIQHQVLTLNLLAEICEKLGPSCLKSSKHVLDFVKATLERGVEVCSQTSDLDTGLFESETITMAIGLVTAILSGALKVTEEDRKQMTELCPLLEKLESDHQEESVTDMATDLRIAIATHGAVWSARLPDVRKKATKSKPTSMKTKSSIEKNKKIEVLSETAIEAEETATTEENIQPSNTDEHLRGKVGEAGNTSLLSQAFAEICDPLIPVRGHGLIMLRSLLEKKDPEALAQQEAILKIFQENLSHTDSYLYLAAINGLVVMVTLKPDIVFGLLTKQFGNFNQSEKSLPVEQRLKIGECLVQACRRVGDHLPTYGDSLLAAILTGVKDKSSDVRASSLSNLGEVCRLLGFSLGRNIHEVFSCCSSVLKTDVDVEVRKAAALVLTLLLQGLGKDAFTVLEDVLRNLYRLLKLCLGVETEEGVLVHIHLALEELDNIMRDYLFPKQTLTKKILVSRLE